MISSTSQLPEKERWRVLFVLLTAIAMTLIGVSIVNVAIPAIQYGLNASNSDIQWVLSGYALTFGIVLVAAGRIGDLMGRGGFFIIGVALFTLSSLAAGLAPTANWLNVTRFVQGVASGIVSPQGMGMIQQYFRGADRARAFGQLGSVVGVSVAIGPVLGGFIIDLGGADLGWRLTFLINIPFGILTMVLGWLWFPRPLLQRLPKLKPDADGKKRYPMDPVGMVLLGLAVFVLLYPFVEFQASVLNWLFLPLGVALIAVWLGWERFYARRGHSSMVNLRIFATPSFMNGSIIMLLYFLGMTSIWVLIAIYVQIGLGMSAIQAGLFGVPAALFVSLSSNWAGRKVMKWGRKIIILGLFFAIFGLLLCMAVVALHAGGYISIWWLVLTLCFVGFAQGSVISPNQTLTLAEVPLDYAGSSGAIMQTGQRIGTSMGIAMITAAVFATVQVASWSVAVILGFALIMLVVMIALLFAFKDLYSRPEQSLEGLEAEDA